jgi:hypothetical protein
MDALTRRVQHPRDCLLLAAGPAPGSPVWLK